MSELPGTDDERRALPPGTDDERRAAGMRTRREVLGDAWVDKAVAGTTPFTADFQDFITRTAWGDVRQQIGRAHDCNPVTQRFRMPSSD